MAGFHFKPDSNPLEELRTLSSQEFPLILTGKTRVGVHKTGRAGAVFLGEGLGLKHRDCRLDGEGSIRTEGFSTSPQDSPSLQPTSRQLLSSVL